MKTVLPAYNSGLKTGDEFRQVGPQGPAEYAQLNHIQTSLAALALADVGLSLPNCSGEVFLRHPRRDSHFAQEISEKPVFASKRRFFHRRPWTRVATDVKFRFGIVLFVLFSGECLLLRYRRERAKSMFGFLAPSGCDTGYRSLYSRCCQHQRHLYGTISLPMLSHEAVFLYALGMDLGFSGAFRPASRKCCLLRTDNLAGPVEDRDLGRFVAAVSMLLGAAKLEDDLRDARFGAGRFVRKLTLRLFDERFLRARQYFDVLDPTFNACLASNVRRQIGIESRVGDITLDEFSEPTESAMEALVGLLAIVGDTPPMANPLKTLGRCLGKAIVLNDCVADWRDDLRRGRPNPVRSLTAAQEAAAKVQSALAKAIDVTTDLVGRSAYSPRVLHSVSHRLGGRAVRASCNLAKDGKLKDAEAESRGVILNATCCFPCGDGAVAVDTNEIGDCFGQLCTMACCLICVFSCCCNHGKP